VMIAPVWGWLLQLISSEAHLIVARTSFPAVPSQRRRDLKDNACLKQGLPFLDGGDGNSGRWLVSSLPFGTGDLRST